MVVFLLFCSIQEQNPGDEVGSGCDGIALEVHQTCLFTLRVGRIGGGQREGRGRRERGREEARSGKKEGEGAGRKEIDAAEDHCSTLAGTISLP